MRSLGHGELGIELLGALTAVRLGGVCLAALPLSSESSATICGRDKAGFLGAEVEAVTERQGPFLESSLTVAVLLAVPWV